MIWVEDGPTHLQSQDKRFEIFQHEDTTKGFILMDNVTKKTWGAPTIKELQEAASQMAGHGPERVRALEFEIKALRKENAELKKRLGE